MYVIYRLHENMQFSTTFTGGSSVFEKVPTEAQECNFIRCFIKGRREGNERDTGNRQMLYRLKIRISRLVGKSEWALSA